MWESYAYQAVLCHLVAFPAHPWETFSVVLWNHSWTDTLQEPSGVKEGWWVQYLSYNVGVPVDSKERVFILFMWFVFVLFDFEAWFCCVAQAVLKFLGSSNQPALASQVAKTTTLGQETVFISILLQLQRLSFESQKACWIFLQDCLGIHAEELCALIPQWVTTRDFY